MSKIRILLIEDNRMLRDGITTMINGNGDVMVAAVSDGRADSLVKARTAKVQLMLIDLGTDSNDGMAIVTSMKIDFPAIKIVGMGLNPLQPDIREYVQAGVDGFILQDATLDEMLATLRTVAGGVMVLPSAMTGSLFSQVAGHAIVKETKTNTSDNGMTQREKEVIALITEGMSNKQIGNTLNIATFTVKSHVHNILEKLAVSSRLQIATHSRN